MDGLTLKIINGNKNARALVKTLVTTPTLINTDIKQGALYAIPLDVETNQKSASAEVSESLVIASNAKEYIADNVAPGPKSWHLSGYITGIPRLEPTNFFQPFVQFHTDILWNWYENGAVLIFKDGNAQITPRVVIKDFQTAQQKDCANGVPFTMTLKEIKVMETSTAGMADDINLEASRLKKSLPAAGTALGLPVELGMVIATTVEKDQEENNSAA